MKVLLAAVNAKYIHTCPAIYSLRAYAEQVCSPDIVIETAEFTINDRYRDVLSGVLSRGADVIGFSTYIWNVDRVRQLIRDVRAVRGQDVVILAGGPEASNEPEVFLREDGADLCIVGEGEEVLALLLSHLHEKGLQNGLQTLPSVPGLAYLVPAEKKKEIGQEPADRNPLPARPDMIHTGMAVPADLDRIPFLYDDLTPFKDRILYYEASRGCPFSCAYCLSGPEKGVRRRRIETVRKELQFFLDHRVRQVKFVDRTFNADEAFAMAVWTYIRDHDNGVTNFHFEIEADRLTGQELALVSSMRPGLIQMEIGVQSANPETLRSVHRSPDLSAVKEAMRILTKAQNINLHLDLIAGLPYEDYTSFRSSFNTVYAMRPHQLQLGFLKLLKGTELYEKRQEYGLVCSGNAPYEVLKTKWISFHEIERLHRISDLVEEYCNSQGFLRSLPLAEQMFEDAFSLFEALAAFFRERGYDRIRLSAQRRYDVFGEFIWDYAAGRGDLPEERVADLLELLRFDRALHCHPARHMILEETFRIGGKDMRVIVDHRNCSPVTGEASYSPAG